jgi:hypothetical protein
MKKPMMASFRTTIEELNQALSRMPMTRTQVMAMTIRKAGRLNTRGKPRKFGACSRAWAARWTDTPIASRSEPPARASAICAPAWTAVR